MILPVEFVVQIDGLRQAVEQLKANRGKYFDSDFVAIQVSDTAAVFRTVGTVSEVPAEGKLLGSVRVPLRTVAQIGEALTTLKTKNMTFHCAPGLIKIGAFSVKNPEIKIDKDPSPHLDLPIDISLLDTLALTKILNPREIAEQGMTARAEDAHHTRLSLIANALASLQPLEIEEWQLNHFVDCHIQDAAKRLQKSLRTTEAT